MRLPGRLAECNRSGTNHDMRPLARWAPALAVVRHVQHWTGHAFEAPVLLFSAGDSCVIPLVHGKDRDREKNVAVTSRFP
jgi:hypothetical protein